MVCRTWFRPVTKIKSGTKKDSQPSQNSSLNIHVVSQKLSERSIQTEVNRVSQKKKSIPPTSNTLNIPLQSHLIWKLLNCQTFDRTRFLTTQKLRISFRRQSLQYNLFWLCCKAECPLVNVDPDAGCGCGGLC